MSIINGVQTVEIYRCLRLPKTRETVTTKDFKSNYFHYPELINTCKTVEEGVNSIDKLLNTSNCYGE